MIITHIQRLVRKMRVKYISKIESKHITITLKTIKRIEAYD